MIIFFPILQQLLMFFTISEKLTCLHFCTSKTLHQNEPINYLNLYISELALLKSLFQVILSSKKVENFLEMAEVKNFFIIFIQYSENACSQKPRKVYYPFDWNGRCDFLTRSLNSGRLYQTGTRWVWLDFFTRSWRVDWSWRIDFRFDTFVET